MLVQRWCTRVNVTTEEALKLHYIFIHQLLQPRVLTEDFPCALPLSWPQSRHTNAGRLFLIHRVEVPPQTDWYNRRMRQATASDTLDIAKLEMTLFPSNCMNEKTLKNELELGECWLVHDHQNEELWGYCLVRRDGELLDILRLGVIASRRNTGIATLLLEQVLKHNNPTILTVKKENKNALRLYLRHGFRIVGYLSSDMGWIMRRDSDKLNG